MVIPPSGDPVIAWSNTTAGAALTGTPVAPLPGLVADTRLLPVVKLKS